MTLVEFISQPWSWWFSGLMIVSIMFSLLYFGQSFGFSANLRTICAAAGLGKKAKFFSFNWKSQIWNLVFLVGAILGGFIARQFLSTGLPVEISTNTINDLGKLGFAAPSGLQPEELFSLKALFTLKGFSVLAAGGLMVGFGARYAGGCTSGHAISGLSDLQVPSLIAVIGFFIGGLVMTFLIFPLIF
ncbi:YeeE/YedE family protein [Flavihumibacter fluvii]|uniref:YeeE/YedE family protein n=1 Tax=Flavihumibacter fluvii TaxID=2838157 RepID=UPI001BDF4D81|nr:YeeE/YedE thiosulfate transporter family protein [Flavihumibacter fluvii]ULQ53155.1 YeeE/YedE family protein [Flavihumibacter fluvii]